MTRLREALTASLRTLGVIPNERRVTRSVERQRAKDAHARTRVETMHRAGAMFPKLYAEARRKRGLI